MILESKFVFLRYIPYFYSFSNHLLDILDSW